jgi:BlaI family penicillinase repressor
VVAGYRRNKVKETQLAAATVSKSPKSKSIPENLFKFFRDFFAEFFRKNFPLDTINTSIVKKHTDVVETTMSLPKLTKLELQIMEALWNQGAASIREIQEAFPERDRPAYTTVQTTMYRMEQKNVLRRVKKISNAHIFEATISRQAAQGRLIDELLSLFGGRIQPVMAHLVETGKLTMGDVREAEKAMRQLARKEKAE